MQLYPALAGSGRLTYELRPEQKVEFCESLAGEQDVFACFLFFDPNGHGCNALDVERAVILAVLKIVDLILRQNTAEIFEIAQEIEQAVQAGLGGMCIAGNGK